MARDGDGTVLMKKTCGSRKTPPAPFTSQTNKVQIIFHSDPYINRKGFQLSWKAVDPIAPTTIAPKTVRPTTHARITATPTKAAGTTVAPRTATPTKAARTTVAPTTATPTEPVRTTVDQTTGVPTTVAQITVPCKPIGIWVCQYFPLMHTKP